MDLTDCIGEAWVISGGDGWELAIPQGCERLLIRGDADVTLSQAQTLVDRGIRLIGTETQKMGCLLYTSRCV